MYHFHYECVSSNWHQLLQLLFMITLIKSWVKKSNIFRSYLLSEYSIRGWTTLSYTWFQPYEEICIDNMSLHELSVIIALATNKTIWKAIASVVAEWWLSWSHIQANFGYAHIYFWISISACNNLIHVHVYYVLILAWSSKPSYQLCWNGIVVISRGSLW